METKTKKPKTPLADLPPPERELRVMAKCQALIAVLGSDAAKLRVANWLSASVYSDATATTVAKPAPKPEVFA